MIYLIRHAKDGILENPPILLDTEHFLYYGYIHKYITIIPDA
ncbi:hypothetical protein HMPREF0322_04304 [Desulfitobacterium hafniense DP7]|uniref:Uncharacterized protein n=1 Tax=Desulfitobacterium hafniense DP7 TaxID=537010 RepID=G9XTJ7_DESHA|nr:hypothetical protein HMPREF0322_04304 [Desulfitobacterium hafniense DP7]